MSSFKIFIFLILYQTFNYAYTNELEISSYISFPLRFNHVIFAVTKNCTEERFKKLLHGFVNLENLAREKASTVKWQTLINFGEHSVLLNENYTVDNVLHCSECYKHSLSEDVKDMVDNAIYDIKGSNCTGLCPGKKTKKYTFIISDSCDARKDDLGFGLMLETQKNVEDCLQEFVLFTWHSDGPQLNFYTVNFTTDHVDTYANMIGPFTSNVLSAKVNFVGMLRNNYANVLFDILECKLLNENSLCHKTWHDFIGYTYVVNENKMKENYNTMALPLYIDEENSSGWFFHNFEMIMLNNKEKSYKCDEIKTMLRNIFETDLDYIQYNILFIDDPLPPCLDFDLQWNGTNRNLEIIVLHNGQINKNSYANLISFSNDTPNHIWFFNTSDESSISNFCEYNTVCEEIVPQWKITEFAQFYTTTTISANGDSISKENYSIFSDGIDDNISTEILTTTSDITISESTKTTSLLDPANHKMLITTESIPHDSFNYTYIIIGGISGIIITGSAILLIIRKIKATMKFKAFKNEIQQKVKSNTFNDQISNSKHCKFFLDNKMIAINFEDIRGKGEYAIVFTGSIIEDSSYTIKNKTVTSKSFSSIKVAVKIQSKFEANEVQEFMAELNSLITLKSHPNILKILGWSVLQETPILITELAETDLLSYVKTFPNHQNSQKPSLQFLWQISDALNFITDKKMIHRDIACRNILIFNNSTIAKLCDFGLCCNCDKNGTYKDSTNNKKFPIKWLSIEVLSQHIFSEKSYVWAFCHFML